MGTAADFPVKWMHSAMPRAPVMNGVDGSLINLLDALLVSGWGEITPLLINIAGGIATCTCNDRDTFVEHCVIEVSGAEPPELNGQARVLTSSNTNFTFATDAPDGVATGAISIKAAPVGWQKVFAAENRAVYKPSSQLDLGWHWLVVENTGSHFSELFGFSNMQNIDEGVNKFPPDGTMSRVYKSQNTSATSMTHYDIFADAQFVIIVLQHAGSGGARGGTLGRATYFGTPLALAAEDNWCAMLASMQTTDTWDYGMSVPRCAAQTDGSSPGVEVSLHSGHLRNIHGRNQYQGIIGAGDGAILQGNIFFNAVQVNTERLRGWLPGMYITAHSDIKTHWPAFEIAKAATSMGERLMYPVPIITSNPSHVETGGLLFLDISGPWRDNGEGA